MPIVNAALPVFFKVTACDALEVVRDWLAKDTLKGLTEAIGAAAGEPVPVRFTVCGLFQALSLTVSVPLRVPEAVGVNVTLMVQLELAAKVAGQLLT